MATQHFHDIEAETVKAPSGADLVLKQAASQSTVITNASATPLLTVSSTGTITAASADVTFGGLRVCGTTLNVAFWDGSTSLDTAFSGVFNQAVKLYDIGRDSTPAQGTKTINLPALASNGDAGQYIIAFNNESDGATTFTDGTSGVDVVGVADGSSVTVGAGQRMTITFYVSRADDVTTWYLLSKTS